MSVEGSQVPHPALTESRQQSPALARLLPSLRMPTGDEAEPRPQRRGAARGAYEARGVAS